MRRRSAPDRMPVDLQEHPADLMDFPAWRVWADVRRAWRNEHEPDGDAEHEHRVDLTLQWDLMFERWGGMPPLLGGQAAADEQAERWAQLQGPVW